MRLRVNGEELESSSATVELLLNELGFSEKKVAVEYNKEVLRRDAYVCTAICDGDEIEIVHFIGGG